MTTNFDNNEKISSNKTVDRENEIKKFVFEFISSIISEKSISFEKLNEAANIITPLDFDDILEERIHNNYCGWLLCENDLTINKKKPKMVFKKGKGLVDQSERLSYCSNECLEKGAILRALLKTDPLWIRDRTLPAVDISILK